MAHCLAAAMEAALGGINGIFYGIFCYLNSVCLVYAAFVAAVPTVVSVLVFGPALAVSFFLFFVDRIKKHLTVVLGRTHFRSQVEFCGLCSSLTCTPSALVRASRAMIEPHILG